MHNTHTLLEYAYYRVKYLCILAMRIEICPGLRLGIGHIMYVSVLSRSTMMSHVWTILEHVDASVWRL